LNADKVWKVLFNKFEKGDTVRITRYPFLNFNVIGIIVEPLVYDYYLVKIKKVKRHYFLRIPSKYLELLK